MTKERKLIAEFAGFFGKHVDVGASAEKLLARAVHDQNVDTRIESSLNDRLIQLLQAVQCVCIGRGVVQLDDGQAVLDPVVNERHSLSPLKAPLKRTLFQIVVAVYFFRLRQNQQPQEVYGGY